MLAGGLKSKVAEGSHGSPATNGDLGASERGRMSGSTEDLRALEADFADPDNVHLVSPSRRASLLPR